MVEQGGAQVSPTERGAGGGGEGLSSGQPPEAEGMEGENGVVCGVGGCVDLYCGGVYLDTAWVKNYNFRIRYKVECAYLYGTYVRRSVCECVCVCVCLQVLSACHWYVT